MVTYGHDMSHVTTRTEPRTVLVGGMFDPPHNGHVAMVAAATIPGDEVQIIVSGVPPHRPQPIAPIRDRLDLAAAAFTEHPSLVGRRVVISDIESRDAHEVSYTIDTVRQIASHSMPGRPVLVIGDEHAATIETWHSWQELLEIVDLAVVTRHGSVVAGTSQGARLESLAQARGSVIWWCPMPPVATSSTGIRARVEAGDMRAVESSVPEQVMPLLSGIYGMIRHG